MAAIVSIAAALATIALVLLLCRTVKQLEATVKAESKQNIDLDHGLGMKDAQEGKSKIFTGLFFEYAASGQESGYGMLGEHKPATQNFMHKDMWLDDEKL